MKDGVAVAFIIGHSKTGYSRELIKDGPWGHIWALNLIAHSKFWRLLSNYVKVKFFRLIDRLAIDPALKTERCDDTVTPDRSRKHRALSGHKA